ncbi:polysaccharide pyruvyl transferase family protein [Calditrichota bacterium]
MRLFYCRHFSWNFGDELNPWLWEKVLPFQFDLSVNGWIFIGIGSILNWPGKYPKAVVFGSGFGYRQVPKGFSEHIKKNWKIYCVRGPLSAKKAGLDSKLAITDSSILIHRYFTPDTTVQNSQHRISVIPHWITATQEAESLSKYCMELGYRMVDPRRSVDEVLQDIANSERIVTESLHGAIVADALRVPWTPLHLVGNHHTSVFKWRDWCKSMVIPYKPSVLGGHYSPSMLGRRYLPALMDRGSFAFQRRRILPKDFVHQLRSVVEKSTGFLSRDDVFEARSDAIQEKIGEFISDYHSGMFDN